MKHFSVNLTKRAARDVAELDSSLRKKIIDKLAWIGKNALLLVHHPLRGEQWTGCYRFRFGNYRIIYQIDYGGEAITVLSVAHRKHVYL